MVSFEQRIRIKQDGKVKKVVDVYPIFTINNQLAIQKILRDPNPP